MPRPQQVIVNIPQAPLPDPQYACDSCNAISPVGAHHSILLATYHYHKNDAGQMTYAGAQCDTQHYACSNDHANNLAWDCLDNHTVDPTENEHLVELASVNLPKNCMLASCGKKMVSDWYSVAGSYNHRGDPSLVSLAYWELIPGRQQLWFCSMDHAKAGAQTVIDLLNQLEFVDPPQVDSAANRAANR